MHIRSFPGMFALRYPFHSPQEGGGIDLEAEFGPEPVVEVPTAETTTTEETTGGEETSTTEETTEETGGEETSETTKEGGEETSTETATAEGEEDEEEPPPVVNKDWKDRQIIKAREDAKRERERAETAIAEAAALKALYGETNEDGTPKVVVTPETARAEALATVRQEQYFERLNTSLVEMDTAGAKAFPKSWETRIAAAREIFSDEMAAKPHFIEAVTDLPNSAAVYHDLAGNPDEFERVLNLPPVKMGMELAKLSSKLAAKPAVVVSRVPAPIVPLDGNKVEERSLEALADATDDESMEAFDRRMKEREKKRFAEQN